MRKVLSSSLLFAAVIALWGCGGVFVARAQTGASLYLGPVTGSFAVGDTFTVSLYLNTGGQPVNAVEADLAFPPNKLQVVSPTTGSSFIKIWVNQPELFKQQWYDLFLGNGSHPRHQCECGG